VVELLDYWIFVESSVEVLVGLKDALLVDKKDDW
jgi:hypothetical protein